MTRAWAIVKGGVIQHVQVGTRAECIDEYLYSLGVRFEGALPTDVMHVIEWNLVKEGGIECVPVEIYMLSATGPTPSLN